MGNGQITNYLKFIFLNVYFVTIFIKETGCVLFRPVYSVNSLMEPLSVIQTRSKLLCVVTCGTVEGCVAVQYNHISSDCALLQILTTSCPTPWEPSLGSQLIQKTELKQVELPVFRTSAGKGAVFYNPWIKDSYTSPCTQHVFDMNNKISYTYKHPLLKLWKDLKILKVELVLFKKASEVVKLVFDGRGTTNMNWFDQDRILESSFTDLIDHGGATLSVDGFANKRRFYARADHLTCFLDSGWLCLKEKDYNCGWENKPPYPAFIYSTSGKLTRWRLSNDIGLADDFLISLVVDV